MKTQQNESVITRYNFHKLEAERDRLKAANAEMLSILNEFLADQETMKEPYRNEAICEKARNAIAKAEGQ